MRPECQYLSWYDSYGMLKTQSRTLGNVRSEAVVLNIFITYNKCVLYLDLRGRLNRIRLLPMQENLKNYSSKSET